MLMDQEDRAKVDILGCCLVAAVDILGLDASASLTDVGLCPSVQSVHQRK